MEQIDKKKYIDNKWKLLLTLLLILEIAVIWQKPIFVKAMSAETIFDGVGTINNPYRIQSLDDLCKLRDLVNEGENFSGKYFLQTENIDMASIINWEPIGIFSSENYFYGTYNGGGHIISNLYIDREEDCAGLFGQLGGIVCNLGIESGFINSSCSGSIASHAIGNDALIINCYNKADIYGIHRAGGIADNFSGGAIINCWNQGDIIGNESIGSIISYDALSLINCISLNGSLYGNCFSGEVLACKEIDIDEKDLKKVFENYSSNYTKPLQQCVDILLAGEGTEKDPYKISSLEDLKIFRRLVNLGYSFTSNWIKQEVDLNLWNITSWEPIGLSGYGKYFYGIYDGYGHTLSNLIIKNGSDAGFFGRLGGTVMNLGIESGLIEGDYVGAIAGHGIGTPMIINCYNKANVYGSERASGISDDFDGGIIANCYNTGNIKSRTNGEAAEICSHDASRIMNCYSSNNKAMTGSSFKGTFENTNINTLTLEAISKNINKNSYYIATKTNLQHNNLFLLDETGCFDRIYNYKMVFLIKSALTLLLLSLLLFGMFLLLNLKNKKHQKNISIHILKGKVSRYLGNYPLQRIFVSAFLLCIIIFAVFQIQGDHLLLRGFIWSEGEDAFMDLFNPMYTVLNNNYLTEGFYTNSGAYPPIARGILWLLGQLFPYKYTLTDSFDMRSNSIGLILWFGVFNFCCMVLKICYEKFNYSMQNNQLLSIALIISYPMLVIWERGNTIIFSFLLSVIYLCLYENEKKGLRLLGYFCLAIAASIKIYPAILGIVVLTAKRKKEVIDLTIIGMLVAFIPFFFIGGIPTLTDYLHNLTAASTEYSQLFYEYYINYVNVVNGILLKTKINCNAWKLIVHYSLYIISFLLLVCSLLFKKNYKIWLSLVSILILFPGFSCLYMLAFYILPLLYLLREKSPSKLDYIYLILISTLILPIQFLNGVVGIAREQIWTFYGYIVLTISLLLILDGIYSLLHKRNL